MNCELCGSKTAIHDIDVEGTTMRVCNDCTRFGKSKPGKKVNFVVREKRVEPKEIEYSFINGYGLKVKAAREKLGLKQDEMAKRLNERESLLHQIESEHLKPSIALARKLERELHIKIVEEIKDDSIDDKKFSLTSGKKPHVSSMTFGDIMKK